MKADKKRRHKAKKSNPQFPWLGTKTLRTHIELGKWTESRLRNELPAKIYWLQPAGSRRVLWNLRLIQPWILDGPESRKHQHLLEEFAASREAA